MTDLELADEIEKRLGGSIEYLGKLLWSNSTRIIAALRRGPDEIDAAYALRMVYLMLRSLRAEIPPGRSSMLDRDRIRNEVLDEVEARVGEMQESENLRSERPPSGEMTFVLKAARELSAFIKSHSYPEIGSADFVELTRLADVQDTELRALSAAEAEGRKG